VLGFQPGAQRPVVPVDLIAGDPAERHLRSHGALDHPPRELRLGRERHVHWDPGGGAAVRVASPGFRQVQFPVDQRVPVRAGISQVDRYLGVLDPPGRSGVLPLHARCRGALLDVPRLINHQDRARIAQVPDDIGAHVVPHRVGVPLRSREQVLHPVRRRVPGMLGDRPAVLARQLRQQPQHERPRMASRLRPAETAADPSQQLIEYPQPAAGVYAGASGHQKIITSRHKPG